jgi:hypothetical protein
VQNTRAIEEAFFALDDQSVVKKPASDGVHSSASEMDFAPMIIST